MLSVHASEVHPSVLLEVCQESAERLLGCGPERLHARCTGSFRGCPLGSFDTGNSIILCLGRWGEPGSRDARHSMVTKLKSGRRKWDFDNVGILQQVYL